MINKQSFEFCFLGFSFFVFFFSKTNNFLALLTHVTFVLCLVFFFFCCSCYTERLTVVCLFALLLLFNVSLNSTTYLR